ncbi:GNAT family N-acetyltransferase [Fibrella aquatica]|jgi:RimJ/RimL family protein N-acetyltransferase|uniref:GNAT family N-acetyltransferase n=1 Tax=Fibrella aquatica TaxID=3242487 RepID=UPI0035228AD7
MHHRIATVNDVRLYFDWANDPSTRQQSFNSAPISWEAHEVWFARKVNDPDVLLLVFETNENIPVGQVRFERQADGEVIIGVSVDNAFRGRGLAVQLIREASNVCQHHWRNSNDPEQAVRISAYIKPNNQPSIRAFERAGFINDEQTQKLNTNSIRLVKL